MAASRTIDAKWTFEHERAVASPEAMYINGALRAGDSLLQKIDYPFEEVSVQSTFSESIKDVAKGACFCGQVQLELPLSSQPFLSAICHCRDCREWTMNDNLTMVLYPLEKKEGRDKYHVPIQVSLLIDPILSSMSIYIYFFKTWFQSKIMIVFHMLFFCCAKLKLRFHFIVHRSYPGLTYRLARQRPGCQRKLIDQLCSSLTFDPALLHHMLRHTSFLHSLRC